MTTATDNLDRVMEDLKNELDLMPSYAMFVVIEKWKRKLEELEDSIEPECFEQGEREGKISTLKGCIKELEAACLFDIDGSDETIKRGKMKAFKLLLEDN